MCFCLSVKTAFLVAFALAKCWESFIPSIWDGIFLLIHPKPCVLRWSEFLQALLVLGVIFPHDMLGGGTHSWASTSHTPLSHSAAVSEFASVFGMLGYREGETSCSISSTIYKVVSQIWSTQKCPETWSSGHTVALLWASPVWDGPVRLHL